MADISKVVLPNNSEYNIKDTTARSSLNDKVDKVSGKGLSTNDYTTTEKNKLAGIAAGAEANVQSDWSVTDTSSDAFIKNKPTIPTKTSDLTNNSNFVSDASYVHTDNNYTTTEKNKLSGIATGAEVNVQSDWNESDTTADSYIQNKPNPYLLKTFVPITNGDDLDDYTTPGEYYVSSSSTSVLNSPVSGKAFRLRVEHFPTETFIKQTWSIRVDNASVKPLTYVRFYNDNTQTWGSWRNDNDGLYARLIGDINIPANSDLNTYVTPGEYKCHLNDTAATITNSPTTTAFRLRVEYTTHDDSRYLRQLLTPYNHRFPYVRVSTNSGSTWNAWVREGNGSYMGMVKLSDTYSSSVSGGDAAGGIAASQNALYNAYSGILGIINGTKYSISGDKVLHTRSTNTDTFTFNSYSNNSAIQINTERGSINLAPIGSGTVRTLAYGVSETWAFTQLYVCGFITSSQKQIRFSLPCFVNPKATKATPGQISVVIRHIGGGYAYMCYGSSNNQYVQLGSDAVKIWSGSSTYTNGVSSITTSIYNGYINMNINFVNTLRTNAGTTVVTNNAPMAIMISGALTME